MKSRWMSAVWMCVILAAMLAGCGGETPPSETPGDGAALSPRLQKARALLDSAGLKTPLRLTLYQMTNPRPYLPKPQETALLIQSQLSRIGIEVEIVENDWPTHRSKTSKGEHDMCLLGWSTDNGDIDNFVSTFYSKNNAVPPSALNVAFYVNDKAEDLLTRGRQTADEAARAVIYKELQELVAHDVPLVPLMHTQAYCAHGKRVQGFQLHPMDLHRFHRADAPAGDGGLKIVSFGRGADSISLDPAVIDDGESVKAVIHLYDTLVRFADDSMNIEPGLAERWDVADEGRTFTFHLRQGVLFHDGTPFDAAAAQYNLQRLKDGLDVPAQVKRSPYAFLYEGIASIETPDAATVVVKLAASDVTFLKNLAMFPASIASPAAVRKDAENYGRAPVGTGPFRFKSWEPGVKVVLEKNPEYWHGAPNIDRLIFEHSKESKVRVRNLLKGGYDMIDGIPLEDLQAIRDSTDVTLISQPGMNVCYLALNTQGKNGTQYAAVRQAIALAIDRAQLNQGAYDGQGVPAYSAVPPTVAGYHAAPAMLESD